MANVNDNFNNRQPVKLVLKDGSVFHGFSFGAKTAVAGEVVRGAQRGRCLGYPTANVSVNADRVIPANGIYATFAYLGEERLPSATSIGVRPTFDHGARSVEVHVLDFQGDLYGRDLVVEFVARLRPEKRFSEVEALVAQIDRDVVQAREILGAQLH